MLAVNFYQNNHRLIQLALLLLILLLAPFVDECAHLQIFVNFGAEKAVVGDKTDQIFEKVLPSLLLLDPTTVMNEHRWLLESFGQIDAWSMKKVRFLLYELGARAC